jgi:peptidoglycan/xylan/chitin deacetylase (PgdA/CDA1 family)
MNAFRWPEGRRCALSLSFDDGRASHAGRGREIFAEHGVRASFYVLMKKVREHEAAWRRLVADGHELGNHTVDHPCSGNAPWARPHALEDYTLERMDAELAAASAEIAVFAGVAPVSYAYCCGQKFVGRGEATRSYVPLIARRFRVGRGFRDEWANDPGYVDLAQVAGIDGDGMSAERILAWVDAAAKTGFWVVIAAHEIGDPGYQTLDARELDAALKALRARPEVWVDTVGAIGGYVAESRLAASAAR